MKYMLIASEPYSLINFRKELISGIIGNGNQVVCLASKNDKEVETELNYIGATYETYPLDRTGLNAIRDIQSVIAIRRAINKESPDVVIAYTIKPVIWTGVALYYTKPAKYFPLITGLGMLFERGSVKRAILRFWIARLYKIALRKAQHVIFQNPDNRQQFIDDGLVPPEKSSVVLGSGVNTELFSHHPLPNSNITFLLIARLLKDKGIREFAEAAKIVKRKYPKAGFVLAGPEDSSPNRLNLSDVKVWQNEGVLFYEGQSNNVHELIKKCHVFVLPSYHEGLPRTVLEAMATGRPVITTDVPGCRETIIENSNGILVQKQNTEDLANAMLWCIENSTRLQAMGNAGRKITETIFESTHISRRLIHIVTSYDEQNDNSCVVKMQD